MRDLKRVIEIYFFDFNINKEDLSNLFLPFLQTVLLAIAVDSLLSVVASIRLIGGSGNCRKRMDWIELNWIDQELRTSTESCFVFHRFD